MGGLRPRQLARIGMVYLEEAILDVLFEAYNQTTLDAKEVASRAGLPTRRDDHSMAIPVLRELEAEGRVENISENNRHRWQLTEREAKKR